MTTRLPFSAIVTPKTAGTLAFAWGSLFVWTPFYDGVDGGVLEDGVAGVALRASSAALHALVARYAFQGRSSGVAAARLAAGAFAIGAVHRAYWMVRLGGMEALGRVGTLFYGPGWAAVFAAVLGFLVVPPNREGSQESGDRALVAAAIWVAFYLNSSMCGLLDGFLLPTFVPLAAVLAARARIQRRRAWLADVVNGRCPGWRVIDTPTATQGLPRLIPLGPGGVTPVRLLARESPSTTPHRDLPHLEPVALVD